MKLSLWHIAAVLAAIEVGTIAVPVGRQPHYRLPPLQPDYNRRMHHWQHPNLPTLEPDPFRPPPVQPPGSPQPANPHHSEHQVRQQSPPDSPQPDDPHHPEHQPLGHPPVQSPGQQQGHAHLGHAQQAVPPDAGEHQEAKALPGKRIPITEYRERNSRLVEKWRIVKAAHEKAASEAEEASSVGAFGHWQDRKRKRLASVKKAEAKIAEHSAAINDQDGIRKFTPDQLNKSAITATSSEKYAETTAAEVINWRGRL